MKAEEIRGVGLTEIKKREEELVEELFRLRIRKSVGQIEKVSEVRRVRRDIARIKTVLREMES